MNSSVFRNIVIALFFSVIAFYGINELSKQESVGLVSAKFISERNEVSALMRKLAAASDINLANLEDYEKKNDFVGALNILVEAKNANDKLVDLVNELIIKTDSILIEANKINDVVLRPQAVGAVMDLKKGNDLMSDYFSLRVQIFNKLNVYYSDFVLNGLATIPDIASDMQRIDMYSADARSAYSAFNQKIELFDKAAGLK